MAAVDVIIPLYNKRATIERAIESVRAQTVTDWHLIVVNDGSTDEGPAVVRRIQAIDPRIEFISQKNAGPGAARNAGIRAATAPIVAFLDADDLWYPWHLQTGLDAMNQNDVALAGTTYYEWPLKINIQKQWARRGVKPGIYQIVGTETPAFVETFILLFHVNTTFVRTAAARRYPFFEEHCLHGEDLIFFARIIFNNSVMLVDSQPTAQYNRQFSELTRSYGYALNPMLLKPTILLIECSDSRKALAELVLARLALLTAYHKARNGYKADALKLVELHPQMKTFGRDWLQCRRAIQWSGLLKYWVKFKCLAGTSVRRVTLKERNRPTGRCKYLSDKE